MSEGLEPTIARFVSTDRQRVMGTGFVLGRYVLTCTHVLNAALSLSDTIPLATQLQVDLPLNPQWPQLEAQVVASFPIVENPDIQSLEDVSILEIKLNLLPSPSLIPLAMSAYHGRNFRILGFNTPMGTWFRGQCAGMVGDGRIQLQVENASNETLNGLSGAPVWDTQTQAIMGMLVAKRGNLKTYMIPTTRLIQAWPALQNQVAAPHPFSAFQQQQLASLHKRQQTLVELLSRQQDEHLYADDPRRQMKLERDMQDTQTRLAQVKAEIEKVNS